MSLFLSSGGFIGIGVGEGTIGVGEGVGRGAGEGTIGVGEGITGVPIGGNTFCLNWPMTLPGG